MQYQSATKQTINSSLLRIFVLTALLLFQHPTPVVAAAQVPRWVTDFTNYINQERTQRGLNPVCLNKKLMRAAYSQSAFLGPATLNKETAHVGPGGNTVGDRVRQQQFEFKSVGENAVSQSTPQRAVELLMGSPKHRENILNPVFRFMGVGGLNNPQEVNGEHKGNWVQVLGDAEGEQCDVIGPTQPVQRMQPLKQLAKATRIAPVTQTRPIQAAPIQITQKKPVATVAQYVPRRAVAPKLNAAPAVSKPQPKSMGVEPNKPTAGEIDFKLVADSTSHEDDSASQIARPQGSNMSIFNSGSRRQFFRLWCERDQAGLLDCRSRAI